MEKLKQIFIFLISLIIRVLIIYLIFYFFTVEVNPILWSFWAKFWFVLLLLFSSTTIDA